MKIRSATIYAGGAGSGCNPTTARKRGRKCGRPEEPNQDWYHTTDRAGAKRILKYGFAPETYFAKTQEGSMGFAPKKKAYVFLVRFRTDKLRPKEWQIRTKQHIPPSAIHLVGKAKVKQKLGPTFKESHYEVKKLKLIKEFPKHRMRWVERHHYGRYTDHDPKSGLAIHDILD